MEAIKKITEKKYFMTVLWVVLIIAVWEIFAFIVAATKRTPENILPHLSGIIESVFSSRKINGGQTAIQMVMTNAAATLSRAGIGYLIGIVSGFVLALLMSLWKPLIFGVIIVLMWQNGLMHKLLKTDEYILPYPTRIFSIIADNSDKIMSNVGASMLVIIIGLIFGSVLGYAAAIGATVSPKFGKGGLTVISAFNAIPIVAMAPVIMNWTKDISSAAAVREIKEPYGRS